MKKSRAMYPMMFMSPFFPTWNIYDMMNIKPMCPKKKMMMNCGKNKHSCCKYNNVMGSMYGMTPMSSMMPWGMEDMKKVNKMDMDI